MSRQGPLKTGAIFNVSALNEGLHGVVAFTVVG